MLADEQRGLGLDGGADHDPHLERLAGAVLARGPQAISRQVDHDQRTGADLRQPAQALERQFELAHAARRRHVQRVDGRAAQHAVLVQPVTGLEMPDCFLHPCTVDACAGRRRIGRQVAQQHQALEQRPGVRIGGAGARPGQRRIRLPGQPPIARQCRLDLPVLRQLRLGRLHRGLQPAGGEPGAQALDRIVALQARVGRAGVVFGTHAAHAQVGQVVQHRRGEPDIEGGAVGLAGIQGLLQRLGAVIARVEALQRGPAQHPQGRGGGRRIPHGRVLARDIEALEPAALVVRPGGRHARLRGLGGQGMDGGGNGLRQGARGSERRGCAQGQRGADFQTGFHCCFHTSAHGHYRSASYLPACRRTNGAAIARSLFLPIYLLERRLLSSLNQEIFPALRLQEDFPMPTFFDVTKKPALPAAVLALAMAALTACDRRAETPPKPTTETPAAAAASVTPEPAEGHAAVPATGPAEGGTAIGGMVANQDAGGSAKGSAPAPTGGDGATTRPPATPSK
jgi:hypothetical protein